MPDLARYDPWAVLAAAVGVWLLLSLAMERLVWPAPDWSERPGFAWSLHLASALLVFLMMLGITGRPIFAAGVSAALWALLIAVNNAKFRALREPFVYSDFALFSQAFRFPRLYLPFLNIPQASVGGAATVVGVWAGLWMEPGLPKQVGWSPLMGLLLAGAVCAFGLLVLGLRRGAPLRFDPESEVVRFGLPATLWLYAFAEAKPIKVDSTAAAFAAVGSLPLRLPNALPHLIAVQSESFFDARRLMPTIRPELLAGYDRIRAVSHAGRLAVPAWGANTMRTEFAFLTGIPGEALGVHRFNPFRRYALQPLPGLAHSLRAIGYRTICIHPHPIGFFGRDRVYPRLGFDRFIDSREFAAAERCGPYVGDAAVTAKIEEVLAEERGPVFLFVITMENHGPLHLERATQADVAIFYTAAPPVGFDDLTVYLRHLKNADRMLLDLVSLLDRGARDAALCFFGDHVPSMPEVYSQLAYQDGRTDYLIWRRGHRSPAVRDLSVDRLGPCLLAAAGLKAGKAVS
jgi:hypothetical protein